MQTFALREPSPCWLAYYSPQNLGNTFLGEPFTWSVVGPLMVLQNSCVFICQSYQSGLSKCKTGMQLSSLLLVSSSGEGGREGERKSSAGSHEWENRLLQAVLFPNNKTVLLWSQTTWHRTRKRQHGSQNEPITSDVTVLKSALNWSKFPIWGCSALHC